MRLLMVAHGPDEVDVLLREAARWAGRGPSAGWVARIDRLWRENPGAFGLVKSVLDGVEHGERAEADWASVFDRLARAAPDGGVALYALGNPDLLRAATAEVVERLDGWGLLAPEARVLEIGCGAGRYLQALSPRVGRVHGLDIARGMIERARERCAGLGNVAVSLANGRDLGGLPDGGFDLVLAADVFPYLVQAGPEAVEAQVAEIGRVLRPGGELVVLNLSYRGDLELDRAELAEIAARHGLADLRVSEGDFALWDAASFRLRRG
jgi:SAM-dependent methyltransferase